MASLKSRIQRVSKLRGSHSGSRLKTVDLFLVGALAGLYSKKLFIEEEKSNKSSANNLTQKSTTSKEHTDSLEKTQYFAASDRLSASVSDYVLKLQDDEVSPFSKGFYSAQVDYIAKTFNAGSNVELAKHTKKTSAEPVKLSESLQTSNNEDEGLKTVNADENNPVITEGIEKASGQQVEPTYQEIIDKFKDEMDLDPLIDVDRIAEEESELIKTAKIDENFDAKDFSEDAEDGVSETKEVEAFENEEGLTGGNTQEKIELADAGQSAQTPTPSGAEAGGAAASTTTSVIGSVGVLPAAGIGLVVAGAVVGATGDSESSPLLPVTEDTSSEEEVAETPVVEVPVVEVPEVVVPETPVSTPVTSSDESSSESVASAAALSFQGRVVDGYVVGATVFYDANNNGILDDSESGYAGVTNADGTFSLPDFSGAALGGSVVVLPGGIDTNTGHEIGAMQVSVPTDESGNPVLSDASDPNAKTTISSPLTLIMAQNSDIIEADLIAQLGMTGVEETGLAYYDPVTEMQAGNNNSLAEYVFTVQQQLFSVIQAGSKIAGSASGLSALEVSVKAVGVAITTALENGEAITVSDISTSAITSVANASGFSSLASSFVSIVNAANTKIEEGYSGLAAALSDPTNTESIDLLSNARATAAASQDTLLSTIATSLTSGSLDVTQFNTDLNSVIAENTAVFGTVLQAEAGDGSSGLSEFGNPAFIVQKLLEQTGTADRDILDLSSSINTMSLEQLSQLGVKHVRLLGSNTSVEISLGDVTTAILSSLNDDASTDDATTTLVDEASVDDALFASNYTVTLKVTDTDVQTIVANATALNAAGIDIIKPVEGTLTLTLAQVQELNTLGFEFASGLVRFSAASTDNLTFDQIYTLLNAGLKLTDASTVTVSIPDGDSRSTFSTIKDLAANGVSFDGGTITLETADVAGSFNVLQAQLLDAAKSNIVFDTSSLSGWSLGKASDGTSLGNPVIDAADVTYLLGAGLTFNDAIVNVTSATDVTTIANNAFDLLTAGVRKFNFSSGVSISTDNATLLLDAKDLTVAQGVSYSDTIFSGSGVLSELGNASLQSLSDYLAEGLGLDTSFVPALSDALALVQLGITFPQGITIQGTEATTVTQSNAELMVAAGVSFNGTFNVTYTKDSSLTEAENLTSIKSLVQAGLTPVSASGGLIQVSGTESSPLYLSPDEFSSLKELVEFQNASLVLMRSSDFDTAFGDLTTNQSYWEAQTAFSKFAVPLSVTPPYSKFSTLANLNSLREESGVQTISIVRVSKSGTEFTELDTNISVRLSNASDLDTINVSSLKSSGVDYVDVLGVPLSVTQIQRFQSNDAPTLQNGQLLISNDNISDASTLFTTSADRNIFGAGIQSFNVATGTSATADVWKVFSDAYDSLSGDSNYLTTKIFDGGIITGSGTLESGVGQVLDRLSSGGLVLSDTYSPSLTEVKEYIDGGGSYSKGIKISLQTGETLTPSEAISLAQANVSFTANTPLDFTGQTKNDLLGSVSESSHVVLFKKLLAQGFLMQNLSDDLLNLDQVTVSPSDFATLKTSGFNFSDSKIEVSNKMELISVSVDLVDETNHGISHIVVPSTLNPTFGQTKQILGAGVAFETQTAGSSGVTVKVNSVSQLESLVSNISSLDQMGVSSLDLEGLNIPWAIAKQFAEAASSVNVTLTNEPGILIGSDDDLTEVAPVISQLYTLGARTISFEDGIEIQAKAANDIIVASDNITFASGSITNADEIADSELKSILSSLKNKGLGVSSDFKPSVSIPLTDNAQTDSEQILSMIRDGYRIKSFVGSDNEAHAEHEFLNVFLSISDYARFSDSTNFDSDISAPTFRDSHVVAKNSQDLTKISTDLQSETSSIGQLNLKSIALADGLSPNLDQLNQFIASGLSLVNVQRTETGYSLSSTTGISLRPSSEELSVIAENADGFYAAGITKLGLYGKEIEVADAQSLLSAGFSFEGGKIRASTDSSENTLNYLTPLAQAGLALPDEISLMNTVVSYDFAMNSFKGSLAGASIDLSDKQGSDSINLNQAMRLVNRDLGQDLNDNPSAFLSSDPALSAPILVSQTDQISSNIAEKFVDLGFNKVVGSINASTVVNLFPVENLDISELAIKGDISVNEAINIVDAGKKEMFEEVKIKDNSEIDLVGAKKIATIDPLVMDFNEVTLSDGIINVQDFFDIHSSITFPSDITISGNLDSIDQANLLISLSSDISNKSFVNLLLKDDEQLIESDAASITHLLNNDVSVYDGFSPTVIITENELTPQNALALSRGFVDLSNKSIVQGESAQLDLIAQLSVVEGLSIQGLKVDRGEELQVASKSDIFSLVRQGVVFDSEDGLPLYGLLEDEFNPIEALDLSRFGGDLTNKSVTFDGYVPQTIAEGLSSINGVDLSNVFVKEDGLSESQILDLELKGGKVNRSPEIIPELSNFNSLVPEISELDPRGQDVKLSTSGTVTINDDRFSEYQSNISSAGNNPGNFEVTVNQNTDVGTHELNWNYEIVAGEIEYLAHGETSSLDYSVSISESFFEFDTENIIEFDTNISIQGSDDQPVISFDDDSDISQLVREGEDFISNPVQGTLNIEERDLSDTVSFKLKELTPSISGPSLEGSSESLEISNGTRPVDDLVRDIEVPIKFSVTELNTNNVIWELSPNSLEFTEFGPSGEGYYSEIITENTGVGQTFEQNNYGHSGDGFYSESEINEVGSGVFLGNQVHSVDHGTSGQGYYSTYFEDYGLSGYTLIPPVFSSISREFKFDGVDGAGFYEHWGNYGSGEFAPEAFEVNFGESGAGYYSERVSQDVGAGEFVVTAQYFNYGVNGPGYYASSTPESTGAGDFVHGNLDIGSIKEYVSPEFSSGEYELDWEVMDNNSIYEQLNSGEVLASDWVFEVTDNNLNSGQDEQNQPVGQEIGINFQANSIPKLMDPLTGSTPILEIQNLEDQDLILTPDDFGYQFYVDADQDSFAAIEIIQFSDDMTLFLQPQGSTHMDDVDYVLAGDTIEILNLEESAVFSRNEQVLDLFLSPEENINGSRFVNFNVGDGIAFSESNYNLDVFVYPVVDKPLVTTSTSPITNQSEISSNINFVSDPSTVYFNVEAVGQNSELTNASLEIMQGEVVLDSKEFDDGFDSNYEYDLVSLIDKHDIITSTSLESDESGYRVTLPVTASISIEVRDQADGVMVEETFVHKEKIIIIPDSTRFKQDKQYEEVLFGSSELENGPISNFSNSASPEDITFIDPTFEKVASTDLGLNGQQIAFDAESILGTDGDDFIFANTSDEIDHGALVHGGLGFDDLTGSNYDDIIYIDHTEEQADVVSGGDGSDVFVISGDIDLTGPHSLNDPSKIDLDERLTVLLESENISEDHVTVAGVIDDFSIVNNDNIVLEGFSETTQHSVKAIEDIAVVLIQEEEASVENFYTAAILMPEYGTFDSSDMDLLNESIHKM